MLAVAKGGVGELTFGAVALAAVEGVGGEFVTALLDGEAAGLKAEVVENGVGLGAEFGFVGVEGGLDAATAEVGFAFALAGFKAVKNVPVGADSEEEGEGVHVVLLGGVGLSVASAGGEAEEGALVGGDADEFGFFAFDGVAAFEDFAGVANPVVGGVAAFVGEPGKDGVGGEGGGGGCPGQGGIASRCRV